MSNKSQSLLNSLLLSSFAITVLFSGIYILQPKSLEMLNLRATDSILTSMQRPSAKVDIVTVAIDDQSLDIFGQWPWPRYRLAQLLSKITEGGARSVGIDIIFAERDRTSPRLLQETLERDLGYVLDTSGLPPEIIDHDIYLANTLKKGPFVLGHTFVFDNPTDNQQHTLHSISFPSDGNDPSFNPSCNLYRAKGVISNYEVLAQAAPGSGFLNGTPDIDGVLRRLPLLIEYGGQIYPSFALAVLMQFQHNNQLRLKSESFQSRRFFLDDYQIPTDKNGNFLLTYGKNENSIHLSASDILEGKTDLSIFNNKIVLLGLTAAGLAQNYPTHQSATTPLLDIYRHAVESLTTQLPAIRSQQFLIKEAVFCLLLSFLLAMAVAYLSTVFTVIFCILSICFYWICAGAIYQSSGYLFSPLLPTLTLALGSCLLLLQKFHFLQQQAKTETGDTLLLLKSSETHLNSILKTVPDIIFRLDTSGNITFISPAISKYIKTPEPLLGHSIFELVAPHDYAKAPQYRLNERRTGERATNDLEVKLLPRTDSIDTLETRKYFSLSAEGIYQQSSSGKKQFVGTQGIIRDITKRKQLENQLIQAQKMEAIGNLAAGIAHDLNNILSGLVSYPDLLLMEIDKNDPWYRKIEVIQKSGKKAAAIVQDLLSLARRNVTIDEICNLNLIIREYLDSVEFQRIKSRHNQAILHTDLQENLPNIHGSPIHLSKVIMNLLINGFEAMPTGGDIIVKTTAVYVDTQIEGFELIPEGEYVCASVSDTGVGIPPADQKRIFEPFFTKKSMHMSGTGLGMTVIWATIKDHRGYIDIQSEEGRGTTFFIYLPASRLNIMTRQQGRIVLDDYLGTETILIVDDVTEQIDIATNMLTKIGYTVLSATSGKEAVELLKKQPVDLVILDMIMPGGLDGLETYEEIIKIYPQQKAIVTSGFSESERVDKLLHLGAGAYVQKPYTMEKIGMAVRNELNRKMDF